MRIIFDRRKLREGDWAHVRGTSFVARFIRRGLQRMVNRLCVHHDVEPRKIWGNHDGLFIKRGRNWYIGEALGSGNKLTPLEVYEDSINAGKEQVRVYRVLSQHDYDDVEHIGIHAAHNWLTHIQGRGYDYRGLFYLWVKSIFAFKQVRDWNPPVFDLLQTKHPTPMTVEQCAGELPQKPGKRVTLREITGEVIKTVSE